MNVNRQPDVSALVSRLALALALFVALAPLIVYCTAISISIGSRMDADLKIQSQALTDFITTQPDTWDVATDRLRASLERYVSPEQGFYVHDSRGSVVLSNLPQDRWPHVTRSRLIYAFGQPVGRIVGYESVFTEALIGLFVLAASLGCAWLVWGPIRRLPLAALRRSEDMNRAIIESSPDCVKVVDGEGRLVFINRGGAELMGLTQPSVVLDKPFLDFWQSGEDRESYSRALEDARQGKVGRHTGFCPTADGKPKWWDVLVTAMGVGGDTRFLVISRDITEQRAIQEELQRSRQELGHFRLLLQSMTENMIDMLWAKDTEGRYLFANKATRENLLLADQEEVLGRTDLYFAQRQRDLGRQHTFGQQCADTDQIVLSLREPGRFEESGLVNGRHLVLDVQKSPLYDSQGALIGTVGTGRDITSRKLAEEELREKTALLEAQTDATLDGILVVSPDRRRVLCNRQTLALFHAPPEMATTSDDGRLLEHVASLVKRPQEFLERVEYLYAHMDLTSREEIEFADGMVLDRFSAPVLSREGKLYGRIWTFRDITERKRSEEAFRNESLRRAILMDKSNDGIVIISQEHRIVEANERFAAMLGYTREELLGLETWAYEALASEEKIREEYRVLDSVNVVFETLHRRKDGGTFPVEVSASGALVGTEPMIFAVCRDITERKRAEVELAQERTRLARVAASLSTLGQDYEENVTRLTALCGQLLEATCALYNRLDADMLCSLGQWRTPPGYEPRSSPEGHICHDVIQRGDGGPLVIRNLQQSGYARTDPNVTLYSLQSYVGHAVRRGGTAVGSICAVFQRDFDPSPEDLQVLSFIAAALSQEEERKHSKIVLEEAKHAAETANRSKSEFLSNMSHEIRTPLNGVLGMLQLLKGETPPELRSQYTDLAYDAGRRLLSLLNDILDFSKMEAGQLQLVRETFNLGKLFEDVAGVFSLSTRQKGLSLSFGTEPGTPELFVGDEARIRQVLYNLVGNAIKFTPAGSVRVEAWARPWRPSPGKTRLYLCVSDTGVGIPDDKQDLVFERFTQTDASTKKRFEGTGLGLAIVKRIVSLMEGGVDLVSEERRGSTFCVHLLLEDARAGETGPVGAEPEPAVAAPGALRLLLADDEPIGRLSLQAMLRNLGHAADTAANGREVLEALRRKSYDCVLMDVQMPEMDGLEATRLIRGAPEFQACSGMPIVAITAYAMQGDKEKILAEGMDDYLAKPVQTEQLKALLDRIKARLNPAPA